MNRLVLITFLVISLFLFISFQPDKLYNNEIYRPQYHFTAEDNFLGRPAGLIFYGDEYHLFYQHNPTGKEEGNSHWGHATSNDLVHWRHLPVAVVPDLLPEGNDTCIALPGSVIVDEDNLLGYKAGNHPTLVIFYTGHSCGQRIAWSNDQGKTWNKYSGNPVIPYDENDDARHPKVFRHAPSGKWVMALYRKPDSDERKRGFSFYTSTDLVTWEYQSHLAGFYESPDIVELQVNNRPDDSRWVIFEANGSYVIGTFNGKEFTPESIRMKSDFGINFYGARTFCNIPAADGRCLQIAWLKDGEWPGMPFHGQFTFPVELSLKKINSGIYLIRQPVKEISTLYGKHHSWKNENLIPGLNKNLIKKTQGECLRIKGRFDLKTCESFGLMLRAGKKNQGTELVYNVKRQTLSILDQTIPLEPVDNKISLDILLDRASVEIFVNNGRVSVSNLFFNQEKDRQYILFNTGGELMVDELDIWEINSVWEEGK